MTLFAVPFCYFFSLKRFSVSLIMFYLPRLKPSMIIYYEKISYTMKIKIILYYLKIIPPNIIL